MSARRLGVCIVCAALGDEQEREIHGYSLCTNHYQQRVRRAQKEAKANALQGADRHIQSGRDIKNHMTVAREFQRFLHFLNTEHVAAVMDKDDIHDLRLHVAPFQTASERVSVPKALPLELQFDAPFLGDGNAQDPEVNVTSAEDAATTAYRKAKAKELTETSLLKKRRKATITFELIQAGCNALEEKYRESAEDFGLLSSAVRFLRSVVGAEE